ncbi:hypothetical protein M407DRAFT_116350 [Tulasnella calospora MUT 4182]|uniref:Uncharacterized protein n=1 Tax=Tulasnella calospora MUT 4182 TaxID=1051891 RepID=A0A0C3QD78_9AGAM|nr:hypothetical protein M407DRAFT_116350 [Tulasnella calospora MUT 4182]
MTFLLLRHHERKWTFILFPCTPIMDACYCIPPTYSLSPNHVFSHIIVFPFLRLFSTRR